MGFLSSLLNPFHNPLKPPGGLDPAGIFGGGNGGTGTAPYDPTGGINGIGGMSGHVNSGEPSGRPGGLLGPNAHPMQSTTGPGGPTPGAPGQGVSGLGAYLQGLGYAGPMMGTQEFRDARGAGDRPYRDFLQGYRQDHPGAHPLMDYWQQNGGPGWQAPGQGWLPPGGGQWGGWGGPNGGGFGGPGHGELPHPPGMPSPPIPQQGVAVGEPNPNGLADLARRPNPRAPR